MTTATHVPANVRKPRNRPDPSPRNQQIYLDYQTTGKRQSDIATEFGLSQRRISQIIHRVERWLATPCGAGVSPAHDLSQIQNPKSQIENTDARDHLERRLQYQYLTEVSRQALRHFHDQQKSTTHKKGTRADNSIDETTERLLPPNIQCLKVVLQANAQLTRLETDRNRVAVGRRSRTTAERGQTTAESPPTEAERREQVEAWLLQEREEAHRAGKVTPHYNTDIVIRDLVSALRGETNHGVALELLAHDAGKKLVRRKTYDDKQPPVPHRNGWYYAMHDADGSLVAWLHADQVADAIPTDIQPDIRVSGVSPRVPESADSAPAPETARSSTSPPTTNSPQPSATPALTSASEQTQFFGSSESQPYHAPAMDSA